MARRDVVVIGDGTALTHSTTRRRFLAALGVAGTVLFLPGMFTACSGESVTDPMTDPANYRLDLSTSLGIMNYLYTLEQVDAAFYTAAVAGSAGYAGLSSDEKEVFQDIQRHEVIHREFLRRLLGDAALPGIAFDAAAMTKLVATRDSLLRAAQLFEDTAVSAYNGAAKYLGDAAHLLALSKIVSVEARHAAAIRDIRDSGSRLFAGDDVVSPASGLDVKTEPGTVFNDISRRGLFVSPVTVVAAPAGTPTSDAPAPDPTGAPKAP